jgi:cytochrome c553
MKSMHLAAMAAASVVLAVAGSAAPSPEAPPAWAFPVKPDHAPADPQPNPKTIEHAPGSKAAYTVAQLNDAWFAPNWFPDEHPAMPAIVEHGRKPGPWPCASCHTETGAGFSEAAALTGLPANYIVEQVMEFKAGRRHAAQPKMEAPQGMEKEAQTVSPAELAAAADYFSRLTYHTRIRVIESDTAPKTVIHDGLTYAAAPDGATETLGPRIVEVPDDIHNWDVGNPHATILAYVPRRSVAKGAKLVASGDGAAPCATCHGTDLKGTTIAPPLAGRSPSYLARQLFDIQYGTRKGPVVAMMIPEVEHMSAADRIAIVAYIASLKP